MIVRSGWLKSRSNRDAVMELLRLRIKDVDVNRHQVFVRSGKGDKDRVTMLPESLVADMRAWLAQVQDRS